MVKAGLLKKFYNGGLVNLRKCARGEGFVDDCGQCLAELCQDTPTGKKKWDRVRRFGAHICSRFRGQFPPSPPTPETGVKDRRETPLKGLPRGCICARFRRQVFFGDRREKRGRHATEGFA